MYISRIEEVCNAIKYWVVVREKDMRNVEVYLFNKFRLFYVSTCGDDDTWKLLRRTTTKFRVYETKRERIMKFYCNTRQKQAVIGLVILLKWHEMDVWRMNEGGQNARRFPLFSLCKLKKTVHIIRNGPTFTNSLIGGSNWY